MAFQTKEMNCYVFASSALTVHLGKQVSKIILSRPLSHCLLKGRDPLLAAKNNHICARRQESNTQLSDVFKDRWVVAWSVQSVLAYDHTQNRDEQKHAQPQEDSQS